MEKSKKNKELIFAPSKNNWLIPHNHGTSHSDIKAIRDIYDNIIKRDNYACYFCGFRSKRHQEIHHINHRHNDFSEKNLTTICPLCHQYFHLSTAGMNAQAVMIFLPEFTQEELNLLCIQLLSIIHTHEPNSQWYKLAIDMYDNLLGKKNKLTEYFHSTTMYEPAFFEQILLNLKKEDSITKLKELSQIIKVLPELNRFSKQAKHWAKRELINLDKWKDLIPEDIDIAEIKSKYY